MFTIFLPILIPCKCCTKEAPPLKLIHGVFSQSHRHISDDADSHLDAIRYVLLLHTAPYRGKGAYVQRNNGYQTSYGVCLRFIIHIHYACIYAIIFVLVKCKSHCAKAIYFVLKTSKPKGCLYSYCRSDKKKKRAELKRNASHTKGDLIHELL